MAGKNDLNAFTFPTHYLIYILFVLQRDERYLAHILNFKFKKNGKKKDVQRDGTSPSHV